VIENPDAIFFQPHLVAVVTIDRNARSLLIFKISRTRSKLLPEQVVTDFSVRGTLTMADRRPALCVISQPDALSVRSLESGPYVNRSDCSTNTNSNWK